MPEKRSSRELIPLKVPLSDANILVPSRVPYHCPEQKSLKEFLESLKSSKSKLIVEEKVEMKTHKFKLLKDVPQLNLPPRLSDPTSIENQNSEGNFSANHHLQAEGTEKGER